MKKSVSAFVLILFSAIVLFSCRSYSFAAEVLPSITGLSAIKESDSITLSWNKSKTAVDGYQIYTVDENGEKTKIKTTAQLSYTVKNLKPNTQYRFVLRTYLKNKDGTTSHSEFTSVFKAKTKLKAVSEVKFVKASKDSITVKWKKVSGATEYLIKYCVPGTSDYKEAGTTKSNQFTVKKLNGKNGWKIRVYAKNETNGSRGSETIKLFTVPSKAAKPEISKSNSTQIVLKWEKSSTANNYYVYVSSASDGKYKQIGKTNKTTFTYKTNSPSTTYYFKICAAVENDLQKVKGELSSPLKAKTAAITASVSTQSPYKGEYINLSVPNYSKAKWTSSNSNVVSISGSRAYACAKGTATLTASYGNSKTSVTITVKDALVSYKSCVYDVTNSKWLYKNNANEKCYPGSITKLVTALVSSKYLSASDVLTVGSELSLVESGASRSGIAYGEKFTYNDLLYAMLVQSGCDAACTIAVKTARVASGNANMSASSAKNYFVSMMNSYMKSIGANNSNFVNPHGYPNSNHYSTASDLCLVGQKVLENSLIKKVAGTYQKTITAITGKTHTFTTTNSMLNPYSQYYSPYTQGLKTGTSSDNYRSLMTVATKDNHTIITVVAGCETSPIRYNTTKTFYSRYL